MANDVKAKIPHRQVVVLIRGYPGVGKTTVALALAKALQYCLICKDDVREAALRHDAQVMADMRATCGEQAASMRVDSNDMTYEAMFAVGLTQLRVGMAGVVLESPLGRVGLGERAVQIARDAQALCVLVDCFAERTVWERRLAMRRHSGSSNGSGNGLANAKEFRPCNVDQIENNYNDIHYKIDCDAHVRVDCGLAPQDNVDAVRRVINQLVSEEIS